MSSKNDHMVPLGLLLQRESTNEKIDKPEILHGQASQIKKGEDFTMFKTECQRIPGDGTTTFSVFGVSFNVCLVENSCCCLLWFGGVDGFVDVAFSFVCLGDYT